MEQFDRAFNITEAFIRENPVYAAWDGARPMGFGGVKGRRGRMGIGIFLYRKTASQPWIWGADVGNMAAWCKTHGIADIHFVTSPQAVGFMKKWEPCRTAYRVRRSTGVRFHIFTVVLVSEPPQTLEEYHGAHRLQGTGFKRFQCSWKNSSGRRGTFSRYTKDRALLDAKYKEYLSAGLDVSTYGEVAVWGDEIIGFLLGAIDGEPLAGRKDKP